jgi:hypothetical protein
VILVLRGKIVVGATLYKNASMEMRLVKKKKKKNCDKKFFFFYQDPMLVIVEIPGILELAELKLLM